MRFDHLSGNSRKETKPKDEAWNRCDVCGKFIPIAAFGGGGAVRNLVYPDSEFTHETWETLCPKHSDD